MLVHVFLWCLAGQAAAAHLRNVTKPNERAQGISFFQKQPPCQCVANDPEWQKSTAKLLAEKREPKCIFIDLGAADGNTLEKFLSNGYGPVKNCPSSTWEAYLVEANPMFSEKLKALEKKYPGQVHAFADTAAFTCEAQTSFFIDTDASHNHWGSSLNENAPDALKSGKKKVTVPMINVVQLVAETVTPQDWVMLKIDIEGAEYNVLPCLSEWKEANLIDRMYLEEHWWFSSITEADKATMESSKKKLMSMHVDIPKYYSETF